MATQDDSDEASVAGSQDGTREAVAGIVTEITGGVLGEKDATEDEIVHVESCPES